MVVFDWQSLAFSAAIITLLIGAISFGIGKAFSSKRFENFGKEEMLQAVISGAIIGSVSIILSLLTQLSSEFLLYLKDTNCTASTLLEETLCIYNLTSFSSYNLVYNLVYINNIIGYYQSITLTFPTFSIQPLTNFQNISPSLSFLITLLFFLHTVAVINFEFFNFLLTNTLGIIFGLGILLRSFFITRKFGSFLISLSFAFLIFYPFFILLFPPPFLELNDAILKTQIFLQTREFLPIPIIDLNNNSLIAEKLYNLSFVDLDSPAQRNKDFIGHLMEIFQLALSASAKLFLSLILAPLFSLIINLILIKELTNIFSGEFLQFYKDL